MTGPRSLVLVRHGQSEWNVSKRFTGWVDVPLTDEGRRQAHDAGRLLAEEGLLPAVAFTSLLRRSISTADLVLEGCARHWVPVRRTWRLNERHYGALQGRSKAEYRDPDRHPELAPLWANPSTVRPPAIPSGDPWDTATDPRYAALAPGGAPRAESLADVADRVLVAWSDEIRPALLSHSCVLVVTHANVIRAIVGRAGAVADRDVATMKVPTGEPLVFDLPAGPRSGQRLIGPRLLRAHPEDDGEHAELL